MPISCAPVWSVRGRCTSSLPSAQAGAGGSKARVCSGVLEIPAFLLPLKESRWLMQMVTSALEMIKVKHRILSCSPSVISSRRICITVKHLNSVAVELRLREGVENSRVAS